MRTIIITFSKLHSFQMILKLQLEVYNRSVMGGWVQRIQDNLCFHVLWGVRGPVAAREWRTSHPINHTTRSGTCQCKFYLCCWEICCWSVPEWRTYFTSWSVYSRGNYFKYLYIWSKNCNTTLHITSRYNFIIMNQSVFTLLFPVCSFFLTLFGLILLIC